MVSFSLNAPVVSKVWEKAPKVEDRIEAARKVSEAGYETRIRIDPMVPVFEWEKHSSSSFTNNKESTLLKLFHMYSIGLRSGE